MFLVFISLVLQNVCSSRIRVCVYSKVVTSMCSRELSIRAHRIFPKRSLIRYELCAGPVAYNIHRRRCRHSKVALYVYVRKTCGQNVPFHSVLKSNNHMSAFSWPVTYRQQRLTTQQSSLIFTKCGGVVRITYSSISQSLALVQVLLLLFKFVGFQI